ncbi:transporter substrate-binding protein [Pseudomonas typographi]|uniref:transporter substrate-binding protein n=1 Tax=Pseudomonas typographi TaxID=2715964 RepID=UPI001689DC51|nr:transporter substrate-binding protein [Pseudomonas typographi]MBD1554124.1 transporter substrate-binding protein [Pseudomonas typographi]MBD1588573.1 transporter substrate-binding protein [Pseudomonas typographi]
MRDARPVVPVGFLLSTEGTYRRMGRSALQGLEDALAEINADAHRRVRLEALVVDPKGEPAAYSRGTEQLLAAGVRHIFGTTLSASRKEIIPDLDQHGALLWYSSPYEGYESSENVLYLGGCPNQTLLPLLRYALAHFGRRAFLLGSNYVWGWESNRIAREVLEANGAQVLGEKYWHLGATGFEALIEALMQERPAFVLNNLVGESSYAFLQQLDRACAGQGLRLPVLSCNLTEAELGAVGPMHALRLLSCGPFFETLNPAFCARQQRHGPRCCSHYYTGAYAALQLFADALQACADPTPAAICAHLFRHPMGSVLGTLSLSPRNHHSALASHIAELREGRFHVLHSAAQPLAADPYLTVTDLRAGMVTRYASAARLRIVK